MAILTAITLIVIPVYRTLSYLLLSQKIHRKKSRVYSVCAACLLLILSLCFIPYSSEIEATGIVESTHFTSIFAGTNGYLKKVNVKNGQFVQQGGTLLEFENNELALSIQSLKAKMTEEQILLNQARNENIADLDSIEKYLLVLEQNLSELEKNQQKLYLKEAGIVISADIGLATGVE